MPARAEGFHDCFSGTRVATGDTYDLTASGRAGSGYSQVTVLIKMGAARCTYVCGSIFTWHGDLTGDRCLLT